MDVPPEVEDLDLRELERKYTLKGMKRIWLKIAEFIEECRQDGYMLPEWKPQITLD